MILRRDELTIGGYILCLILYGAEDGFSLESSLTSEGIILEHCYAEGVTDDLSEAEQIYTLLWDNLVYPNHLKCVLGDVFGK